MTHIVYSIVNSNSNVAWSKEILSLARFAHARKEAMVADLCKLYERLLYVELLYCKIL